MGGSQGCTRTREDAIRTISVSLLAAAAIAVGVAVSRARHVRTAEEVPTIEKDDVTEGGMSLEALRAAGI